VSVSTAQTTRLTYRAVPTPNEITIKSKFAKGQVSTNRKGQLKEWADKRWPGVCDAISYEYMQVPMGWCACVRIDKMKLLFSGNICATKCEAEQSAAKVGFSDPCLHN